MIDVASNMQSTFNQKLPKLNLNDDLYNEGGVTPLFKDYQDPTFESPNRNKKGVFIIEPDEEPCRDCATQTDPLYFKMEGEGLHQVRKISGRAISINYHEEKKSKNGQDEATKKMRQSKVSKHEIPGLGVNGEPDVCCQKCSIF